MTDELLADRYELAEVIGVGGMAEVRRAQDTLLGREVAVKLFAADTDLANARRFDNEVRILAGLSHPGLVSVHDAGTSGRTRFVVLRLVDGPTLRHRMAEGPLPVEEVRTLGAAVADALAHVHGQGVVHRDVKPSNILLDADGTPYLADFGLAHTIGSTRLTRTGLLVGTAAYIAPEQVRGAGVDSPADVYALGLVLLECLTGHCEYTGSDVETIVSRLHRSPVVPAHLPADLARLLTLMTSQSPADRPTARQCADTLRSGDLPTTVMRAPRRTALVATAAGILGALCLGWALAPDSAPPVSESPGTADPAVVVESTTTAPQPAAMSDTSPPATQQQTSDQVGAAAAQAQDTAQAQQAAPAQEPAPAQGPAPVQADGPGQGEGHGPGKKDEPPGQAKKDKP